MVCSEEGSCGVTVRLREVTRRVGSESRVLHHQLKILQILITALASEARKATYLQLQRSVNEKTTQTISSTEACKRKSVSVPTTGPGGVIEY